MTVVVVLAALLAAPPAAPTAAAPERPRPGHATAPGARVWRTFEQRQARRLVPLLSEVLRFPTVAGDAAAFAAQRAWLHRTGGALGFVVRDAGTLTEIELPGPDGAPVLGLLVHGDLQPVTASEWTVPPFAGVVKDGAVWGRGAADDKGPLVQALLAMAALRDGGVARTHTVRLLVGTDEESGGTDVTEYRKTHAVPDLTLVLDSDFPVVVGEKAWAEWTVTARRRSPPATDAASPSAGPRAVALAAGQRVSIVPDLAVLRLRWDAGTPDWTAWLSRVTRTALPPGTRIELTDVPPPPVEGQEAEPAYARDRSAAPGRERWLVAHGRAAHAGVALQEGRNALVALAAATEGVLDVGPVEDVLAVARLAGRDVHGTGLGLAPDPDPLWGGHDVNVGTVTTGADGAPTLHVNVRSPPSLWGSALQARLGEAVAPLHAPLESGGTFTYEPFVADRESPLVRRLLAAWTRATGQPSGAVTSAGGTYARRFPASIAFGMWFRADGPYPGHAPDERVTEAQLRRGARVLVEALADLATGPRVANALGRTTPVPPP